MLIYNCLNVYTVCFAYFLRTISVCFAYTLLFSLTNNMLIVICLRAIFAYNLRTICVLKAYFLRTHII